MNLDSKRLIEEQVERIVSSEILSGAPSLCRFLRFVVRKKIEGKAEELKEYTIGVDALGKDKSFDPRVTPIVRVQARTLRAKLGKYYEGPGAADPLVIELPKGGYEPVIHPRREVTRRRPIWRYWASVAAAGLLAAAVLLGRWSRPDRRESITVRQLTFGMGGVADPVISRDAKLLAYSADRNGEGVRQIWVQRLRGGEAVPITCSNANHITPDLSSDGTRVVHRSFESGGGIYISPVLGGEERRIVDGGFRPRFSPDGAWVAYSDIEQSGWSGIYVVPSSGGRPVRLSGDAKNAGCPVWDPKGRHIVFRATNPQVTHYDLWVASFSAGEVAPIGASDELKRLARAELDTHSCPVDWVGDRIILSQDNVVWQVPFSSNTWKVAGSPTQILSSPLYHPRMVTAPDGHSILVFVAGAFTSNIWSLPVDANRGQALGPLEQLTRDASIVWGLDGTRASLSPDGTKLTYDSGRMGSRQLLLKDLAAGMEASVTPGGLYVRRGLLSPDGAAVAFETEANGRTSLYVRDLAHEESRELCGSCGHLLDLSADGKRLLTVDAWTLYLINGDGSKRVLLKDSAYHPREATFSRDGKWIALVTTVRQKKDLYAYLVPVGDRLADSAEWVPVTKEPYDLSIHWSPDGNLLYFFQLRDGFRCLWAQRLDQGTKRLVGPVFAVRHFHGSQSQRYPNSGSWLSVARDRVAMTLQDSHTNIWMADLGPRLP